MPRPTLEILENLVRYTSVRQKVIGKNLANADTEMYQRQEVNFEKFLSEAAGNNPFNSTNSKHFLVGADDSANGTIRSDKNTTDTAAVNNVVVDKEMADLAENQILFKFAARKISGHFKTLQEVIKGGRA